MANSSSTDQTSTAQAPERDNSLRTVKLIRSRFDSLSPRDQEYLSKKLADPNDVLSDENFRSMKLIASKFKQLGEDEQQYLLRKLSKNVPQAN
jgi:hypothetical protein